MDGWWSLIGAGISLGLLSLVVGLDLMITELNEYRAMMREKRKEAIHYLIFDDTRKAAKRLEEIWTLEDAHNAWWYLKLFIRAFIKTPFLLFVVAFAHTGMVLFQGFKRMRPKQKQKQNP